MTNNNHTNATAPPSLRLGWGSPLNPPPADSAVPVLPWLGPDRAGTKADPRQVTDTSDTAGTPAGARTSDRGTAPPARPDRPGEPAPPPANHAARTDPTPHAATTAPPGPPGPPPSEQTAQPRGEVPLWGTEAGALSNAVRRPRTPPRQGWRAALYKLTGWNPGTSEAEQRRASQLARIRTPLHGPHSILVGSIKGGIGKTTVASLLGLCLAEHRGDGVIAVDANPDAGTLGDRLVGEELASKTTVRDLLDALDDIRSFTDLSLFTQLAGDLQVLTSEQDPEESEAFSAADYEAVLRLLSRYFPAIITDSGTGVVHSAMRGSLQHADSLVIVGALTQDGASRAARTLNWLADRQYSDLAREAVVVLSRDRHSPYIDEDVIRDHFRARCRAVIEMPADPHLATGGLIDLDALKPATRDAALEFAATVAEGFHGRRTTGLASHGFRTGTAPR